MVATSTEKPQGPKYGDLAKEAILAMKDRNGSSLPAIKKYFKDNFPTSSNEPALKAALKHGVSKGVFVKVKASYKVSQDAKKAPKKKAATAKKPAAKKPEAAAAEPAKKTAAPRAKKAAAPKKTAAKKPAAPKTAKPAAKKAAPKAKAPATKKAIAKKPKPSPKKK